MLCLLVCGICRCKIRLRRSAFCLLGVEPSCALAGKMAASQGSQGSPSDPRRGRGLRRRMSGDNLSGSLEGGPSMKYILYRKQYFVFSIGSPAGFGPPSVVLPMQADQILVPNGPVGRPGPFETGVWSVCICNTHKPGSGDPGPGPDKPCGTGFIAVANWFVLVKGRGAPWEVAAPPGGGCRPSNHSRGVLGGSSSQPGCLGGRSLPRIRRGGLGGGSPQ